jgi:hypothetical protein
MALQLSPVVKEVKVVVASRGRILGVLFEDLLPTSVVVRRVGRGRRGEGAGGEGGFGIEGEGVGRLCQRQGGRKDGEGGSRSRGEGVWFGGVRKTRWGKMRWKGERERGKKGMMDIQQG